MSASGRTRWGWHQLADDWARRLVGQAEVGPGDLVLDIGAGAGALTRPLVATGARVIAIERHHGRACALRQRFDRAHVTVVEVDAADLRLPRRPFHVVANPPFALTTAILRRLLAPGSRLVSARLVVPRHVAVRWATRLPYGGHRWSRDFVLRVGEPVPRRAFRPPAPGQAAVLHIDRRR